MGTCFKTFKGTLYKKCILKDKEPNQDGGEYTKQKDFRQEFKNPLSLPIALIKYKTILGLLVRDFIPIKYRKWIGKDDDRWRVLESEKDHIWDVKIPEYFTFPVEYDRDMLQEFQGDIVQEFCPPK